MPIIYVESDTVTDKLAETTAMQRAHWDEVALNKHLMVLSPDVEQYERLERAGLIFCVYAYDGERMVGYSVNILSTNLHYSSLRMSNNDVIFVDREYRSGPTGVRLIERTKKAAAKRGVRMMLFHAKENTPLAAILPRMGCKVQDILFSQELAPSHFRLFGSFDVAAALAEQAGNPLWDQFTARQGAPGSAHHDTRCIVLRGPDSPVINNDVVFNMLECADTPNVELCPAARDLCIAACDRLKVQELGRVMLVELAPGGHIDLHADEGAYAEHFSRFHLPLQSDAGNLFCNGDESTHMQPGELWQFNHRVEHEVFNRSDRPRVHLIIDAITK